VYQPAVFADGTVGFSLARLHGDRNDTMQQDFYRDLHQLIAEFALDRIKIEILPIRARNHREASEIGLRTNAAVVLWGTVPPQSHRGVELNLTVARTRALPPTEASYLWRNDADRLIVMTDMARPLVFFLAGYERYFAGDYPKAIEFLRDALGKVPEDPESGLTPLEVLRGSIHFYLANGFLACAELGSPRGCKPMPRQFARDLARQLFMRAAEIVAEPPDRKLEGSRYIEALNNLALLEKEEKPNTALDRLRRAQTVCVERRTTSCLYVYYNIGTIHRDAHRYADAIEQFQLVTRAAADLWKSQHAVESDSMFLANSYQNLAYSYAKMAEYTDDANERRARYEDSTRHMENAIRILQRHGEKVSNAFNITKARIAIGMDRWQDAIELLTNREIANEDYEDTVHLLLAVAYECADKSPRAASHLEKFRSLAAKPGSAQEGQQYYDRVTSRCRSSLVPQGRDSREG